MRLWPFGRQQEQEQRNYTDQRIERALGAVSVGKAEAVRTGAVEACAGLWARALAMAMLTPATMATRAVNAAVLYDAGRDLVCAGESVFVLTETNMMLRAVRCSSWDVYSDGDAWRYRITVSNPSMTRTRMVPAAGVLHFRINTDALRPERGRSPVDLASLTAGTAAGVEAQFAREAEANHGYVIPAPLAGLQQDASDTLRNDLKTLKGNTALVPDVSGFGDGRTASPHTSWQARRLGMNPGAPLVDLRDQAAQSIIAACGVPVELLTGQGGGTARREAWRQFLHGTIQPVAEVMAVELTEKLEVGVSLSFDGLFASDVQGRARAFQSLRQGGLSVADAARATGVQVSEAADGGRDGA